MLHPVAIFSAVWLGVVSLYSLHLSKLLLYTTYETSRVVLWIWAPFALAAIAYLPVRKVLSARYPLRHSIQPIHLSSLDRQLVVAFRIWMTISVVEIIFSGGIPIVWLMIGSTKTYVNFGIPSLHGFVNSLILSISLCRFALFLITSDRRHLRVPAFILLWSMLVVTRNLMLVSLIQFLILFVRIRPIRKKTVINVCASLASFVLLFGIIGDYRSGSSDLIRQWAQPTDNYPEWLPSGLLWGYIYTSTPINNLIYTSHVFTPLNSITFPNTVSLLFPSLLRNVIYGEQLGDVESGQLVDPTFNVSTGYIGPYQDLGFAGILLFSVATSFFCMRYWYRNDLKGILIYTVLGQCLVLSLFWNQFFSLPIITQLFWLEVFLRKRSPRKNMLRLLVPTSASPFNPIASLLKPLLHLPRPKPSSSNID
ncbi:oligosaccharide repeat unit polymerase [Granulicella aggregans]|uniref:Oligosaccharide repeat unit polymerase n=1 Tax=Granulicella aggregans TaxID=474949 RepID=A0A7W7ZCA1_9BACT|nr:oligosaccharide repeat unit polymerase [Granulicella aggregans]